MSNPTTLTEQFNGSSGGFTITGPERYDSSGLWLEEATTNQLGNPNVTAVGSDFQARGTSTRTQESTIVNLSQYSLKIVNGAVDSGTLLGGVNLVAATDAQTRTYTVYLRGEGTARVGWQALTAGFANIAPATFGSAAALDANIWTRFTLTFTTNHATTAYVRMVVENATNGATWYAANFQDEIKDHATSQTTGARAASSVAIATAAPTSVACWYREGYSGAKTFAYLEPYGTLGTYGSVAYAAGDLTISTSRNLVIGPFAAFSRALTATEQANLKSTQNWSMNSVNGSNIILPLSGRRR